MQETANVTQVSAKAFFPVSPASALRGVSPVFGEVLSAIVARVDSAETARFEARPAGTDGSWNESAATPRGASAEAGERPRVLSSASGPYGQADRIDARPAPKPGPQAERPRDSEAAEQTAADETPVSGEAAQPSEKEAEPAEDMPEAVLTGAPAEAAAMSPAQSQLILNDDAPTSQGGGQTRTGLLESAGAPQQGAQQAGAPLQSVPQAGTGPQQPEQSPAAATPKPPVVGGLSVEQDAGAPRSGAAAEQPLAGAADDVILNATASPAGEPEGGAAAGADSTASNQGIAAQQDAPAAQAAFVVTDSVALEAQTYVSETAGSSVPRPQPDVAAVTAEETSSQEPSAQEPSAQEPQAQGPQAQTPRVQEPQQAQESQAEDPAADAPQKSADLAQSARPNSAEQTAGAANQAAAKHAVNANNYAAVSSEPQAHGGFNAIPIEKPYGVVYAVSFEGERPQQMSAQLQDAATQFANAPADARIAGGEADARGMSLDGRGSGRAGDGTSSQARSEAAEQAGGAGRGEFAQRLSGARSVPRADQVETIDKIVKSMTMAVRRGESEMRIMLQPPRLGSVRVELVVRNGALTASFETQTQAARHVISGNLAHLKAALESQGIEVEGLNVSVEREAGQSTFTNGRESSERFPGDGAFASEAEEEETYDLFEEKRRMTAGTSLVDYFV